MVMVYTVLRKTVKIIENTWNNSLSTHKQEKPVTLESDE